MPITASDIVFRLSTKLGAAGDTTASTAGASLGKYVSTTVAPTGLNQMFDAISGAENAASVQDYRCIFVLNNHATLSAEVGSLYLVNPVAGGAGIDIALDNIGITAKGSASAQAAEVANETTAPTGVGAFSAPTTDAGGLVVGTLAPGQVQPVWIRRTAANSAALDADGVTLRYSFDTAA